MVYCHTLMEIDAVFIGYLCDIPIPHRNSRFEATNYSSNLRCLEDFVYHLVWKACVTGRYLLKTWCLPVFFISNISLKGIQTGLFFDIIQNFSSSTWCHFLNPYQKCQWIPFLPSLPHQPRELPWVDERVEMQRAIVHLRGAAELDNFLAIVWKVPVKKQINPTKKTIRGALAASWESIYIYKLSGSNMELHHMSIKF